jgi:hypothetical protein
LEDLLFVSGTPCRLFHFLLFTKYSVFVVCFEELYNLSLRRSLNRSFLIFFKVF